MWIENKGLVWKDTCCQLMADKNTTLYFRVNDSVQNAVNEDNFRNTYVLMLWKKIHFDSERVASGLMECISMQQTKQTNIIWNELIDLFSVVAQSLILCCRKADLTILAALRHTVFYSVQLIISLKYFTGVTEN